MKHLSERLTNLLIKFCGEIPNTVYHGSPYNLKIIDPKNRHGDPDYGQVVFASPSKTFALPYAGRKWGDRDLEQSTYNGVVTLREMRPNAFDDIFKNKKGYIYELSSDTFEQSKRETPWEIVSKTAVAPISKEIIPDVLEALQNDKNIRLFKYDINAPETLEAVKRTVKRMLQLSPDGQKEYYKWRLKPAPPEMAKIFEEELSKYDVQA